MMTRAPKVTWEAAYLPFGHSVLLHRVGTRYDAHGRRTNDSVKQESFYFFRVLCYPGRQASEFLVSTELQEPVTGKPWK